MAPNEPAGKRRGGYGGNGKKAETKRFLAELKRVAEGTGQQDFSHQEMYQIATEMRLQMTSFQDLIDGLNLQGFLLRKGNQRYKLSIFSI